LRKNAWIAIIFCAMCVLAGRPASADEPAPQLVQMKDTLSAIFKPMEGKVLSSTDSTLTASFANSEGLQRGMRFRVLRQGAEFVHPVTGEPIGRVEQVMGMAEITNAPITNATAAFKLVEGHGRPGDVVRISDSRVRILFYQLANVNWALSEEYFDILRDSGRFELLTTSYTNEADAVTEGKKQSAEAVLVLSQDRNGEEAVLSQKLLWVPGGGQVLASSAHIAPALYHDITLGEDVFTVKEKETAIRFKVPFGAEHLLMADLAGNGKQELLLDVNGSVRVYEISSALLEPAFGGQDIVTKTSGQIIRMDRVRLEDRDGVIITSFDGHELDTSVFALVSGKFKELSKIRNIAFREVEGSLYAQKFDSGRGFIDSLYGVRLADGKLQETGQKLLNLPPGVNIFDFSFMRADGRNYTIAYDDAGYLNVYDEKGVRLWRSEKDMGGFVTTFKKESSEVMLDRGEWSAKDRLTVAGKEVVVIERNRLFSKAGGLGFSSSGIKVYRWNGASMEERTLVDNMSGTIYDYAPAKDNILVLASPLMGLELKNIFQGRSPVVRMVYIYPFAGKDKK
jgi:hypothetical protein